MRSFVLGLLASLLVFTAPADAGQTTPPAGTKPPPLIADSMVGKDLFRLYCGSCHGADGRGNGPASSALKTPPANLTTIRAKNGGTFPREEIVTFITKGDRVAAHGSSDMPVWGPIFLGLDPSPARTRVRIDNLVSFIESLQAK
jgi:mono/diheme cytochrome c family protein